MRGVSTKATDTADGWSRTSAQTPLKALNVEIFADARASLVSPPRATLREMVSVASALQPVHAKTAVGNPPGESATAALPPKH